MHITQVACHPRCAPFANGARGKLNGVRFRPPLSSMVRPQFWCVPGVVCGRARFIYARGRGPAGEADPGADLRDLREVVGLTLGPELLADVAHERRPGRWERRDDDVVGPGDPPPARGVALP